MSEAKKYVDVQAMFNGVDKNLKKLLCSPEITPHLVKVLSNIDPDDISPGPLRILEFAKYVTFDNVKVVLLGQDPHPDPAHAHGLCFSSRDEKIPALIKNIYTCLAEHGHIKDDKKIGTACLESWAAQGVYMMNTALTCRKFKSKTHSKIWEPLTREIIKALGAIDRPIAFILWGNDAKKMKSLITSKKAVILEEEHPSPMSQARLSPDAKFRYCDHFDRVNEMLLAHGQRAIDWNPTTRHIAYTDGSGNNTADVNSRAGYAAYFLAGPLMQTKLYGKVAPATILPLSSMEEMNSNFEWNMLDNPIFIGENKTDSDVGYVYKGEYHKVKNWESPLSVVFLEGAQKSMVFPTSQRGEGMAILMVMERIIRFGYRCDTEIVTDSKFWITMIEQYIPKWVSTGISFNHRKNPDLVSRIWRAVNIVRSMGELTMRHIYSHGKNKNTAPIDKQMNDLCDVWANKGRTQPEYGDYEAVYINQQ
jgi:uracil-DNA glycosylase